MAARGSSVVPPSASGLLEVDGVLVVAVEEQVHGRPAAWVNVVGLGVMVFNLLYVNMVSTGLHSYGGVS